LCRANGLTELACNASLLARWITSKGVLTTEAGTELRNIYSGEKRRKIGCTQPERTLLKRVVDGCRLGKQVSQNDSNSYSGSIW